jgi:hypothetical protein
MENMELVFKFAILFVGVINIWWAYKMAPILEVQNNNIKRIESLEKQNDIYVRKDVYDADRKAVLDQLEVINDTVQRILYLHIK